MAEKPAGIGRLRGWARQLKKSTYVLYLAYRDPRTPWYARAFAAAVVAYAISPIDLIPDFIPVIGYLDDLLIVPIGFVIAMRLIPPEVMADSRAKAALQSRMIESNRAVVVVIAAIWLSGAALVLFLIIRAFR
jgi:uncharacterized membrane protein YkvA (DUF1232 family)